MEFFDTYNRRQGSMNLSSVLDFTPLSKPQKEHLTRVYSAILLGICVSAAGVWFHNAFMRLPVFVSVIAQLGFMMALSAGSIEARMTGKALSGNRMLYFGGFSFFMGTSIADLISFATFLDPGIVIQAFFASIAIFVCFSAAAMLAKQRSYIFLGSILFSAMTYFSLVSLVNLFFQSTFVHNILLYGTLLTFMGFVIYDTQVTIEDFNRGNRDYIMHAVCLYGDLFAIFVRILIILMDKSEDNKKRERRRH
eukprot:GHVQ01008407.1.p2 GENE.GHVQ01008407.1~~GHVQ01008407.1.p2  ORF type:complete len:251 (+),score=13.66 GHVQ01008407.1:279-1031(+)